MISCYICDAQVQGGWVAGLPPAPDSQKLGLCSLHNNETNRAIVQKVWQLEQEKAIGLQVQLEQYKIAPYILEVTIFYNSGGIATLHCAHCAPTPQKTLLIEGIDGKKTYIPLAYIKEYTTKIISSGITNKKQ